MLQEASALEGFLTMLLDVVANDDDKLVVTALDNSSQLGTCVCVFVHVKRGFLCHLHAHLCCSINGFYCVSNIQFEL